MIRVVIILIFNYFNYINNILEGCLRYDRNNRLKMKDLIELKLFDKFQKLRWEEKSNKIICECCNNVILEGIINK
jgi:hypothetical protein